MREIKFRGWDVGFKEMESWESLLTSDVLPEVLQGRFPNLKLMQYTGRKDKNGVDVYEGDVITAYFDAINGKYLITYTVKYDEFHSLYPFADFDCYESPMHFTIIGNRYENPELLKDGI